MLIGQLSRRTGFSKDTIRYYEKLGLITLPKRSRMDQSYKDYPEELIHTFSAIRKYKELGFTLEEIRELLARAVAKVLDITTMLQVVEQKIAGTNATLEQLHAQRLRLNRERQVLLRKKTSHIISLPEMKLAA
jgi:MerR family transcriptional regulator, copper efflux regulator